MLFDSHKGRPTRGRMGSFILLLLAAMLAAPHASAQQDAVTTDIVIEAQPLENALIELSRQSGIGVFAPAELIQGIQVQPVRGKLSMEEALRQLLAGTGLTFQRSSDGGYVITPPPRAAQAASDVEVARRDGIEEIIVTGQKREERIQDVPIAISAFSMENLDNQKIEGGFDLLKAVPNVTFSKSNFTGYNFQIRGIGTQAISATTDPGVAVSFNNTTLIVNRLFEQEYLDIERVEVLRGPQGTLYGRNATAGVINVISAKPEMEYLGGEWKLETGNYGAQRFRGHINIPAGEVVALRAAFAMTKRDGYGKNLAVTEATESEIQKFMAYGRESLSDDIDNRDLWTGRFSLGWKPTESLRANLIYERFEEDDRRMRSAKQLCHYADGNVKLYDQAIGGQAVSALDAIRPSEPELHKRAIYLAQLTQGCLPGSLYDRGEVGVSNGAYSTPNGNAIPFIRAARGSSFVIGTAPFPHDPGCMDSGNVLISNCVPDPLEMKLGQSRDLRSIYSLLEPRYKAMSELIEMSFDVDLNEQLLLSSQTVHSKNELFSTQDFLRFKTLPMFNDSKNATNVGAISIAHRRGVTPGGVFSDPQLGPSDRLLMQDVSQLDARQFSQEVRLASNFDGQLNFSIGANYTKFDTVTDYFVFINMLSALVYGGDVYAGIPKTYPQLGLNNPGLWGTTLVTEDMTMGCGEYISQVETDIYGNKLATCVYVQEGDIDTVRDNPEGHNFFLSRNPYSLRSSSVFGELYYQLSESLKFTAGIRFNWDKKTFTPVPSQTLLGDWRGRLSGGNIFNNPIALPINADVSSLCHPQSPDKITFSIVGPVPCALGGLAPFGKGYPALPDLVQEWRTPTGRIGIDWKLSPVAGWVDDALVYAFYTRGYKAGGANPPTQSAPSGLLLEAAQGAAAPRVFNAEYVNAVEIGMKTRLFGGMATINTNAFIYDYTDYQVSKIVDRTAVNENVDASIWGAELEAILAPAPDLLFNASIGYLQTRIGSGEQSLDLMDRTQGGNRHYVDPAWASINCALPINAPHIACERKPARNANGTPMVDGAGQIVYEKQLDDAGNPILDSNGQPLPVYLYRDGFDQWVLVRPSITQASSCVAPAVLVYNDIKAVTGSGTMSPDALAKYCPAGPLLGGGSVPLGYSPFTSAPNGSAGFLADIGGHELPNAPQFTVALGAQKTVWFGNGDWSASGRVDWYWQAKSFHRMYNTEYDRLNAWSNTNMSIWVESDRFGLVIETYVKNLFNDSPVTGAFLNSDDTGLSTNVFTLDPRLIGISIRKRF